MRVDAARALTRASALPAVPFMHISSAKRSMISMLAVSSPCMHPMYCIEGGTGKQGPSGRQLARPKNKGTLLGLSVRHLERPPEQAKWLLGWIAIHVQVQTCS